MISVRLSRTKKNTIFAFSSSAVRIIANILFFVGVARVFGPVTFGQFMIAQVFYTVFVLVADFGTDTLFVTEISRDRGNSNRLFEEFLSAKLVLWMLAILLMCLVPAAKRFGLETNILIYIFALNVGFTASMNFFFALFKGHEQFRHETIVTFIINLSLLVGTVVLILLKTGPWVYAALFGATRLLGTVLCYLISRRFLNWKKIQITTKGWSSVFKRGWAFGIHLTFAALFLQLDTLILTFMLGDYAVGIYQAAMKLLTVVLIIPDIASNVFLPVLSRYSSSDENVWVNSGKLLSKTLSLVGIPISIIFFVFSDQIIRIVYGPETFSLAGSVLRLFGVVTMIRFSAEIFALMLTSSMRQDFRMKVVVAGTFLNLAFNLYAIPKYGVIGAAVVSVVTNAFLAIGYIIGLRRWLSELMPDRRYVLLFIGTLVVAVVMWFLRSIPIFVTIPSFLAIYAYLFYNVGLNTHERALIFEERIG